MAVTSDPRRLGGVARLYRERGAESLNAAHVVVIGLGGVGSWAVEALARTGVGTLTIIDGDCVALSNTNRQLPALEGNYGRQKVEVVKERILAINPNCRVRALSQFLSEDNVDTLIPSDADWVIDCIDDLRTKTALVACVHQRAQKIVVSGGGAGRRDPGRVIVEDIARVKGDPLIAKLRTNLRQSYGYPRGSATSPAKKFGILAVVSDENVLQPQQDNARALGLEHSANMGFGSGVVVTATFGLRLASIVINDITTKQ